MHRIFGVRGPSRLRSLPHSTIWRLRYSLASRIRGLLPDLGESPFEEHTPRHSLNESIDSLLHKKQYLRAAEIFASNTTINSFTNDFEKQVLPHVKSQFCLQEIQFCMSQIGLEALVGDKQHIDEFNLLKTLESLKFDPKQWDTLITASCNIHFPQILWSKNSSLWLKTRIIQLILDRADEKYAQVTLKRYIGQLNGVEPVEVLASTHFDLISNTVFEGQLKDHVIGVLQACPPQKFQKSWRRLKAKEHFKCSTILSIALKRALQFNMTYEITNICKYGRGMFTSTLLTRALLAVAWGQKKSSSNDDDESFTTASHVETDLIKAVLKSLPENVRGRVIYRAVQSSPPPNILWALLLAWDQAGCGKIEKATCLKISSLLVQRPHLEQLRYMALKSTSPDAVSTLLRANVQKVQQSRASASVNPDEMIDDMDVKLFIGGMVLLSEKLGQGVSAKSLGLVIDDLFTNWTSESAQNIIDTMYKYHTPSAEVTMTMVAMLLRHKNYTQAIQVLHSQAASDLPPKIFHRLLLQVCSDFPAISTTLMTWVTSVLRIYLPPTLLQKMVISLSKQKELSDRQSMLRINSVQKLLRGQKASLGPEAAAAIVDGLLERAMQKPGGSRNRLQWALDISKEEGVPQEKVKEWVGVINRMRADGKGYWHKGRK